MGCIMTFKNITRKKAVQLDLTQAKSKYIVDTARNDDAKLPALFVFCGKRGSGKHILV